VRNGEVFIYAVQALAEEREERRLQPVPRVLASKIMRERGLT
jgi:hypothetical protein